MADNKIKIFAQNSNICKLATAEPVLKHLQVGDDLSGTVLYFDTTKDHTVFLNEYIIVTTNNSNDVIDTSIGPPRLFINGTEVYNVESGGWLKSSYELPDNVGVITSIQGRVNELITARVSEDLIPYKYITTNTVDPDYGFSLTDTSFDALPERINGITPKTPASSISMNTALRQTSTIANILGQVLATNDLITGDGISVHPDNLNDDGTVVEADIQTHANNVAEQLTNYLMQINNLQNGTTVASSSLYAINYDTENGNINETFEGIKNGSIVCGVAQNYVVTNSNGEPIQNKDGTYDSYSINNALTTITRLCDEVDILGGTQKLQYRHYSAADTFNAITISIGNNVQYSIAQQGKLCVFESLEFEPQFTNLGTGTMYIGNVNTDIITIQTNKSLLFKCVGYYANSTSGPPSTIYIPGFIGQLNTSGTMGNIYLEVPSGVAHLYTIKLVPTGWILE